jgi:hypothetical protein
MEITIQTRQEKRVSLPDSRYLKHLSCYYRLNGDSTVTVIRDQPLESIFNFGLHPYIIRESINDAFGYLSDAQINLIEVINEDTFNNAIHRVLNTITNE